jgi:hypothetical protein
MTMTLRAFTILIACFLISCSDNKPKVTSIEYIGFNWTPWDAESKQIVPFFFKCRSYAYIDNQGKVKAYLYGNVRPPNSEYLLLQFSPEIIKRLETIATKRNQEITDSIYNLYLNPVKMPPSVYDGPHIKVRINYADGNSFIFSFIEDQQVFQMFPQLEEINKSMYGLRAKAIGKFIDTLEFNKTRLNFIKSTIRNDTCFKIRDILPIRILFNNKIVYGDSLFKMY